MVRRRCRKIAKYCLLGDVGLLRQRLHQMKSSIVRGDASINCSDCWRTSGGSWLPGDGYIDRILASLSISATQMSIPSPIKPSTQNLCHSPFLDVCVFFSCEIAVIIDQQLFSAYSSVVFAGIGTPCSAFNTAILYSLPAITVIAESITSFVGRFISTSEAAMEMAITLSNTRRHLLAIAGSVYRKRQSPSVASPNGRALRSLFPVTSALALRNSYLSHLPARMVADICRLPRPDLIGLLLHPGLRFAYGK